MPLPELIEAPQNIQFICIGQCVQCGNAHQRTYTPAASDRTIRRAADLYISENLILTVHSRPVSVIRDYKKTTSNSTEARVLHTNEEKQ